MFGRSSFCMAAAVAILVVAAQGAAAGCEALLPAGVKAVWDLDKAYCETTLSRQRISINGLWRFQPAVELSTTVPVDDWGYCKVPAPWAASSQTRYPHPAWRAENANMRDVDVAWYQREVVVPRAWQGRRVAVYAECVNSYAALFLDGRKLGDMYFPSGEVDITSACRPGEKQVLSLCVKAVPLAAVVQAFTDTSAPKTVKGRVDLKGLCGDVYLLATPKTARIEDVKVNTSVRKWAITFDVAVQGLSSATSCRLRAQVYEKGRPIKDFTSEPFTMADLRADRFSHTAAWHPEKLWDTSTPQNMYDVKVSLVDRDGQVLDAFYPQRFGFREFWIEGRDFYLNGASLPLLHRPLRVRAGGSDGYLRCRPRDLAPQAVDRRQHGLYAQLRLRARIAPELQRVPAGGRRRGHVGGAFPAPLPALQMGQPCCGTEQRLRAARRILRPRGRKSSRRSDVLHEPQRPELPRRFQPRADRRAAQRRGADRPALRSQRPQGFEGPGHRRASRPHARRVPPLLRQPGQHAHQQPVPGLRPHPGALRLVRALGKRRDQTVAALRVRRAVGRQLDHVSRLVQGRSLLGKRRLPWEFCMGEWNSQFLGDRAFQLNNAEKVNLRWETKQWRAGQIWNKWHYPQNPSSPYSWGHKEQDEVWAMYITDNWRAFRALGVSARNAWGYSVFWELRDGAKPPQRRDLTVDWDHLQRPGLSPDCVPASYNAAFDTGLERSDWIPTKAAAALLRNNMPLLAYIAGKPAHVTEKGHDFLGGQTVQKQIIVINDSRSTAACDCSWSLALPQPLGGSRDAERRTGPAGAHPAGPRAAGRPQAGRLRDQSHRQVRHGRNPDGRLCDPRPGPQGAAQVANQDGLVRSQG